MLTRAGGGGFDRGRQSPPGAEITLRQPRCCHTGDAAGLPGSSGVTRISFGVQSADDAQLRRLAAPTPPPGPRRRYMGAEAGFPEICGDIMLALPE